MSRVPLLVALAVIACQKRPVIQRFSVDEANPDARAPVHFSFSVSGATTIRIDPLPGVVAESPVTVVPIESATFTLRAFNDDGVEASASLPISVRAPFEILLAEASPGQVTPGNQVRLSWVSSSSERASLTNETTGEATDVAANGSMIVHPAATTIYTLTIFNRPGRLPASRTGRMTARVAPAPSVGDFIATPAQILQGQSSTLTWKGNAVSYSVATAQGDGAPPPFFVGPQRSLVVRPQATTTYSLQAVGPLDGALPTPLTATVTVIPNPGATLAYHPPTPTAGQLLQLVADPCPAPCTTMTFHIVPSGPAVPLRGLAFNLPLDTTKVTFNRFATGARLSAADARATMGSGPLKDVLVVGIALRGSGTAPAADVSIDPLPLTPDAEVGRFVLQLVSAGGVGPIFDGSAPLATYKASIQRASGRSAGAIAVGKLEAQ